MNADPQLRDRLRAADDAVRLDVEAALTAARHGVEARHRRRRVEALVLVAAIVGLLVFAGWRASIAERTNVVPLEPPTGSVVPQNDRIKVIPPPPGVHTEQTVEDVERYVLDRIAADEARLGGSLAPARIISVRYLRPHEQPPTARIGANGFASWFVTFEGTVLNCDTTCSGHPGGAILISDEAPDGHRVFRTSQDTICVARLPGTSDTLTAAGFPPCEQIMTVRP